MMTHLSHINAVSSVEDTCGIRIEELSRMYQYRIRYIVEYTPGTETLETFFTLAASEAEALEQLRQILVQ